MGSSAKRLTLTFFRGAPRGGDATIGTSSSKDGNKGGFRGDIFAKDLQERRLIRIPSPFKVRCVLANSVFCNENPSYRKCKSFNEQQNAYVPFQNKQGRSELLSTAVDD